MNEIFLSIILIILNYLVGSISSAILISKYIRKVDIRKVGFKTAGGSNVAESIGFKWGFIVGAFDLLKGIPILILAKFLEVNLNYQSLIAIAPIIGHCWPIWFKFAGGRGLATFYGVSLLLFPKLIIYPIIAFAFTIFPWYLRKFKKIEFKLISSPTLTLAGIVLFVILTIKTNGVADNIFSILSLIIILTRRVTARPKEYKKYNPIKLFFSRLIFDESEAIK